VFKGRGVEFDEVRPYVPGDDVRTIDWNVTARVGAPYVKRYIEERQLTVVLLVDVSASQDFGSGQRSKREAAVELSAMLAFSAINNDDKIGLLLFHRDVVDYIPPRKGQKHALRVVREVLARGREEERPSLLRRRQRQTLASLSRGVARRLRELIERSRRSSDRSTDIAHALEFCRRVLPRRAVLFLISDFLDEDYLGVLRHANRKHDVVAVRVTDRREEQLDNAGLVTLQDAETGQTRLVDTGSAAFRERHAERNRQRVESIDRELRGAGIDILTIDATRPTLEPLLAFFRMREKRARR
jgi:uncharacterized protein (DUF58 family)